MKIDCGIIGLPNVGKSTLFKTLTNISVKIANFPFSTIQPNVAAVYIPDDRLYKLNCIIESRAIVHGIIEFIDIAGLIKGAAHGEGLGNHILNHICKVKVLCHMVRCFDNDTIVHIENNIDPCRDVNIVNTELILFDILQCETNICYLKKHYKNNKYYIDQQLFLLEKCLDYLYKGFFLKKMQLSQIEQQNIQKFNFLTFKPVMYIANVDSEHIANNIYYHKLSALGAHENIPVVLYCAVDNMLQTSIKLNQSKNIIKIISNNILLLLHLNTFFTVNENMIRAWINIIGTTAFNAAHYVHSDFKKAFIRVQIIKFNDFIEKRGEIGSKKSGKVLYSGKNYCIEDGDVLKYLFQNTSKKRTNLLKKG